MLTLRVARRVPAIPAARLITGMIVGWSCGGRWRLLCHGSLTELLAAVLAAPRVHALNESRLSLACNVSKGASSHVRLPSPAVEKRRERAIEKSSMAQQAPRTRLFLLASRSKHVQWYLLFQQYCVLQSQGSVRRSPSAEQSWMRRTMALVAEERGE